MTGRLFEDPPDEPIVPSRGFPYGKFENKEPLARSTDPSTSHAAAKAITASGQRDSQKARVLRRDQQEHPAIEKLRLLTQAIESNVRHYGYKTEAREEVEV